MQGTGLIVSNLKVMMGKPVIRGTRITVELILEKFAAGQTEEQILRGHPHITSPEYSSRRGPGKRHLAHELLLNYN